GSGGGSKAPLPVCRSGPEAHNAGAQSPVRLPERARATATQNPLCSGGLTGGPPLSRQQSFSRSPCSSCNNSHATHTVPLPFDSAPYLTALVPSSYKPIASYFSAQNSGRHKLAQNHPLG